MLFCLIHLDAPRAPAEDEEVYVVVPVAEKTAMVLALDALPQLLPVLEQAVCDLPLAQCSACNATLPSLVVCPSPQNDSARTG